MLMSTTASSFFSSKPLPLPRIPTLSRPQLISTRHASIFSSNSKAWATKTTINASSSESQTVSVAPSVESASDVVRSFYGGINGHDMGSVEELIAENCVYEDLIFSRPFVGRKAILEFFNKFIDTIRKDLQFVIDDISNEDSFAIGITWHLEWKGKTFPFSKGCSFYRLAVVNGKRQIIYGRDSVCSQAWGGGFVFVEKILRVQPKVKKLYLLLRAVDTKSAEDRLHNEMED